MADLPAAPWPPLSRFPRVWRALRVVRAGAGQFRRGASENEGEALPAFHDARRSTMGTVAHDAGPGQEDGCHLPTSGTRGSVVGCRPSALLGSNYPNCRSSASAVAPPPCTGAVADSGRVTDEPGRPNRVQIRCKLSRNMLARSNGIPLSALAERHTISESLSVANRARGAPASFDHLKKEIPPTLRSSARGGRIRGEGPCPPSNTRVFSPPAVGLPPLAGNDCAARTAKRMLRS